MGTPQIIFIALSIVSLLLSANMHGKERTGKHNFWVTFIRVVIMYSILYWGGFFNN